MKKTITEDIVEKGYKPVREGYQPNQGKPLDSKNPPQGGSGLPSIPPGSNNQNRPQNQPAKPGTEKDK